MLGCALRCHGDDLDVDAFLSDTPLEVRAVWRRGLPWRPGSRVAARTSGFALEVSSAVQRPEQVGDAQRFLDEFEHEVRRLVTFPGVERAWLDFVVRSRLSDEVIGHAETFPRSLLERLVRAGLDLEVTVVDGDDIPAADLVRAARRRPQDD